MNKGLAKRLGFGRERLDGVEGVKRVVARSDDRASVDRYETEDEEERGSLLERTRDLIVRVHNGFKGKIKTKVTKKQILGVESEMEAPTIFYKELQSLRAEHEHNARKSRRFVYVLGGVVLATALVAPFKDKIINFYDHARDKIGLVIKSKESRQLELEKEVENGKSVLPFEMDALRTKDGSPLEVQVTDKLNVPALKFTHQEFQGIDKVTGMGFAYSTSDDGFDSYLVLGRGKHGIFPGSMIGLSKFDRSSGKWNNFSWKETPERFFTMAVGRFVRPDKYSILAIPRFGVGDKAYANVMIYDIGEDGRSLIPVSCNDVKIPARSILSIDIAQDGREDGKSLDELVFPNVDTGKLEAIRLRQSKSGSVDNYDRIEFSTVIRNGGNSRVLRGYPADPFNLLPNTQIYNFSINGEKRIILSQSSEDPRDSQAELRVECMTPTNADLVPFEMNRTLYEEGAGYIPIYTRISTSINTPSFELTPSGFASYGVNRHGCFTNTFFGGRIIPIQIFDPSDGSPEAGLLSRKRGGFVNSHQAHQDTINLMSSGVILTKDQRQNPVIASSGSNYLALCYGGDIKGGNK